MSLDDRKSQKDVNKQMDEKDLRDLSAKKIDEQEANQVKGGFSDLSINKKIDKSSPL